ncbi:hypothetical protein BDW68DRAFT_190961 [Aspergillus falconensis]
MGAFPPFSSLVVLILTLLIPATLHYLAASPENSSTPIQKAELDEVASMMLDIYQTLAEMRYLDPDSIQEGPHDLSSIRSLYQSNNINLDPAILYLYSILPYIGEPSIGVTDFFHGGTFADFRDEEYIDENRDPFYASLEGEDFEAENGPYMMQWMTALSRLGNHGSVLIYDARLHRVWVIDQEGWWTTDPGVEYDDQGRQGEMPANRNSIEHFPSRSAGDVLWDINRWYRELAELPGGGEYSGARWNDDEIDLRSLYRKNGWPDAFDGEGFEVDKARAWSASTARYRADGPRIDTERLRQWREGLTQKLEQHRRDIENAASMDEEWAFRFEAWRTERSLEKVIEESNEQEKIFARQCPGAELLRQEVRHKRQSIEDNRNRAEECRVSGPERAWKLEVEARIEENEANIYQKAYEAAVADVERLCPWKTFSDVSGRESLDEEDISTTICRLKKTVVGLEKEIEEVIAWARQVPDEGVQTKALVQEMVRVLEGRVKSEEALARVEGWWAENGDEA